MILHYVTRKHASVNRKSLETVLWAMAMATQPPLLGGASWTAAWRLFVRGSPERDWVLTGLLAAECKVWWANGKTEKYLWGQGHTCTCFCAYVNETSHWKEEGQTELFPCDALSCDYCRELTCSIHVEHETFLGYFTVIRMVFKKKKKLKPLNH